MATQSQYYTENGDDLVEDFSEHAPQGYDPGMWLFSGTAILVMVQFVCCMPILVWITRKLKAKKREAPSFQESLYQKFQYLSPLDKAKGKSWTVPKLDKESRYLLLYSIPFAIYSVGHALMENACLVMVGNFIGSKELAAYVLTILLTDLSGQFLRGVIHANTTLCAQAIGANNYHLAGQYIQLSITVYLAFSIPIAFFWSAYMKSLILQLDWGDDAVANYAHEFVNIYIWSQMVDSMHLAIKLVLDVVGKEMFSAIIGLIEEALNTLFLAIAYLRGWNISLQMVAWIYLMNACTFTLLTLIITVSMGWLQPFRKGILQWFAIFNGKALHNMLKICIPISFESLFNNSRWLILAEVASHLGEAEVAAWAIMCRIWLVSDALAEGIGQAAEIRVAFHLGNNHPNLAKMFAYKSILLGMFGAFIISGIFYVYLNRIPSLITKDETLQSIMTTTLPYVGFGNMALSFSYLSWYIIGAQGRFKLGMLVSLASLWGITVPLAIVFTWKLQWNLSGLCSAVVMGYTAMGVSLSFFALTSDWEARAQKIYERNAEDKIMEDQDRNYATPKNLRKKSLAVNAMNGLRFKVVTLPHEGLMIKLKLADHTPGFEVLEVNENPFLGNNKLFPGDIIVGWNQISLEAMDLSVFEDLLNETSNEDHVVSVISPRFREENMEVDFEFDHSLNFMAFDI